MEEITILGAAEADGAATDRKDGAGTVRVLVRRSARARRLTLRVSRHDGGVTLTLPRRTPLHEGAAFAQSRADWIARALAGMAPVLPLDFGGTLPFRGRDVVLTPARLRAPRLEGDALLMPDDPARIGARAKAFCKTQARAALAEACDRHAQALGRGYGKLTLRDTRSRWGSCSSRGDLMFSWRLILAPPAILDYVAAHEIAHLAEMNHSSRFWAVCRRLYPDAEAARAWLRREGDAVQRIDFGG